MLQSVRQAPTGVVAMNRLSRLLSPTNVVLDLSVTSKKRLFEQVGLLFENNHGIERSKVFDSLFARERLGSTGLGEGVAIPHGTNEARDAVKRTQLAVLQFPQGVDWNGKHVNVVIPIASNSDEHVGILSALAGVLADKEKSKRLATTTSVDEVLDLLTPED